MHCRPIDACLKCGGQDKGHKRRLCRRGALAQEAGRDHRTAQRGGAADAALQEPEQDVKAAPCQLDDALVDEYLSVPLVTTAYSILSRMDPRHDMYGIRAGIERGGYRRALKMLLDGPPPRNELGMHVADNRARMLERLGRHEEAEPLYRELAGELPGNSDAQLDMARVLEHLGRRKESAEALERACRLDPDCRQAFEAGMRPDSRQLDPSLVPPRLILPMSVISAAGAVRSRAELSAASLLVQAECGLDLYPPSAARLPGCAGIGADMERFYHLVVEDVLTSYHSPDEQPYYYDLTDKGIKMIERLGGRLDGGGGDAAARIAASARRVARMGPHAVLEEACRIAAPPHRRERADDLAALRSTAERIRREVRNSITFGEAHAVTLRTKAKRVPDMLSQARDAPGRQWDVAAALGVDILGMCAYVAFDQRPHPRTASLGPPYPDIQDQYSLLVRYCRARGIAEPRVEVPIIRNLTPEEIEETTRDMLKVISES